MNYISLYRRYRPQDFKDVSGQESVVQTLKNAIANDRLSHAYIFSGPRGTGKTSMARILAKSLNCRKGKQVQPCNACDLCIGITEGTSIDVMEIDAASNRGIDEIRQLRERVNFAPAEGLYKVYIIDEVHMLTKEAFNALLKTLEEPPAHAIFILATTEPQKIPETIISRCQRLDFNRLTIEAIKQRLRFISNEENLAVEDKVLVAIARSSEGGMRDAISLLDQLYSFAGNNITMDDLISVIGSAETDSLFDFAQGIASQDTAVVLGLLVKYIEEGKNIPQVTKDLLGHFRYIMFAKLNSESVIDLTADHIQRLKEQSKLFTLESLKQIIATLSKADASMRWYPNSRLLLEIAMIELTTSNKDIRSNSEMINQAESKVEKIVQAKPVIIQPAPVVEAVKPVIKDPDPITEQPITNSAPLNPPTQVKAEGLDSPPVSPVTLADIKHQWQSVLNNVKSKKITTYTLMCEGEPLELEGDKLIIGFKPGFTFHKEKLVSGEHAELLITVLREIFSVPLKFDTVIETPTPQAAKKHEEKSGDEFNQIIDLFGGALVT